MPRLHLLPLLSFFAFAPTVSGCGVAASIFGGDGTDRCAPSPEVTAPAEEPEPSGIRPFTSEGELDAYVAEIEARAEADRRAAEGCSAGAADDVPGMAESSGAAPAAPNENVTNNQEAGVDEGGIVKNIGDALVVLRKGRLYAISVASPGEPVQTDAIPVAPVDALNQNVWYDEMLVRGDRIYVIGYRYGLDVADEPAGYQPGATEVSSFRLANGKIERLKTLFLESNDYYSGSNYASRMIDGKLVFYMPHGLWSWYGYGYGGGSKKQLYIPSYFESNGDGTFVKKGRIFQPTDVYVPIDVPKHAAFHTVVKCELPEDGGFDCQARSLLSNGGREHYVTPDAVFLWSLPRAYMFRFSDLGVVAHRTSVRPSNQFSFKLDDGTLRVVGNEITEPTEDAPYGYVHPSTSASIAVESLPISAFDVTGEQLLDGLHHVLPDVTGYLGMNRFVGKALFLGAYDTNGEKMTLVRHDTLSGSTSKRVLDGYVARIEPLGDSRALVVSSRADGLALDVIPSAGAMDSVGVASVPSAGQGEHRSHGFFFKPRQDGGGAFALPIINANGAYGGGYGWGNGISNIGFWDVAPAGTIGELGVISSSGEVGTCETSCVDWYGNTRPIFLRERAFALMGSELVEIAFAPGATRVGQAAILQ